MKKILLIASFALFFSTFGYAQDNEEYREALSRMMKVSGSHETFKAGVEQIISIFKTNYKHVPETTWDELRNEFLKTSMDDLMDMLQLIYQKYLTAEDLNIISEFYETESGKKLAGSLPAITQESMQVGSEWGQKIAKELEEKLKTKGYE